MENPLDNYLQDEKLIMTEDIEFPVDIKDKNNQENDGTEDKPESDADTDTSIDPN